MPQQEGEKKLNFNELIITRRAIYRFKKPLSESYITAEIKKIIEREKKRDPELFKRPDYFGNTKISFLEDFFKDEFNKSETTEKRDYLFFLYCQIASFPENYSLSINLNNDPNKRYDKTPLNDVDFRATLLTKNEDNKNNFLLLYIFYNEIFCFDNEFINYDLEICLEMIDYFAGKFQNADKIKKELREKGIKKELRNNKLDHLFPLGKKITTFLEMAFKFEDSKQGGGGKNKDLFIDYLKSFTDEDINEKIRKKFLHYFKKNSEGSFVHSLVNHETGQIISLDNEFWNILKKHKKIFIKNNLTILSSDWGIIKGKDIFDFVNRDLREKNIVICVSSSKNKLFFLRENKEEFEDTIFVLLSPPEIVSIKSDEIPNCFSEEKRWFSVAGKWDEEHLEQHCFDYDLIDTFCGRGRAQYNTVNSFLNIKKKEKRIDIWGDDFGTDSKENLSEEIEIKKRCFDYRKAFTLIDGLTFEQGEKAEKFWKCQCGIKEKVCFCPKRCLINKMQLINAARFTQQIVNLFSEKCKKLFLVGEDYESSTVCLTAELLSDTKPINGLFLIGGAVYPDTFLPPAPKHSLKGFFRKIDSGTRETRFYFAQQKDKYAELPVWLIKYSLYLLREKSPYCDIYSSENTKEEIFWINDENQQEGILRFLKTVLKENGVQIKENNYYLSSDLQLEHRTTNFIVPLLSVVFFSILAFSFFCFTFKKFFSLIKKLN